MPRELILVMAVSFTALDPPVLRAESAAAAIRRPVALVAQHDRVLVANRRSGTITVIDSKDSQVSGEHRVATRIADMAAVPEQHTVFVADDMQHRLIKVSIDSDVATTAAIAELPRSTSRLLVSKSRRLVFASARWSRCVAMTAFDEQFEHAAAPQQIKVPFAAQEMLLLNSDATLLVADAFGGQIAVIDVVDRKLLGVHRLSGHTIRGLATSGSRVLVAHQRMDPLARADYEYLHWWALVANSVRVLDADQLSGQNTESVAEGWLDYFGGIGSATGDPSAIVTGPAGLIAVALSGIGEVAIRRGGYSTRLPVGRRPEAMAVSGDRLYVANRFDDSISVVDLPVGKTVQTIPLGPVAELSAVDRGELLFFDARLSHDGWMSCHSCHTDGHSSGLLVDTLGDGDYGAPKRVPSLLGTRNTGPWAWNGSVPTLAEQVRKSVTTTMHGDTISKDQTDDLVAYLESLQPPPSANVSSETLTARGQAEFTRHGCVQCHAGPNFTSPETFDVGLSDEENRRRFNPPSLRGVGQRDRLFHDGRANGLEDAIGRVGHRLDKPLSGEESAALLAYLRSL